MTQALFRHSQRDGILCLLALVQGAALLLLLRAAEAPLPGAGAAAFIALGLWWNSNTISHNHLHNPLFRARWLNRLFSLYLSALLGVPQALWRRRHLWHHAGEPARPRVLPLGAQGAVEIALVAALFCALLLRWPSLFFFVYLPGYGIGMALCRLQGHFEHAAAAGRDLGGVSHYGALHNLLWFNDGYHAEHHRHPGEHWTRLPSRRWPEAPASAWPPLLRWLGAAPGAAQATALGWLERLALHPGPVQRFMLRTHQRALAALLPAAIHALGGRPPRHVAIVGGGLFPRTAIILRRLLPEAELILIDRDAAHLQLARAQFLGRGEDPARLRLLHADYDPDVHGGFDLVVAPLAYVGDRARLYASSGPPRLVHDWLWHARGAGVVVSPWLLKRLNLVTA